MKNDRNVGDFTISTHFIKKIKFKRLFCKNYPNSFSAFPKNVVSVRNTGLFKKVGED